MRIAPKQSLGALAVTKTSSFYNTPVKITSYNSDAMSSPALDTRMESARLNMLEARKALEHYEELKGVASDLEHKKLVRAFTEATELYLMLSSKKK